MYDLGAEAAQRSGEAQAGIVRLMSELEPPPAFAPLIEAVRACNAAGGVRLYPGSPWLAAGRLVRGQTYVGCELHGDEHAALSELFRGAPRGPELRLVAGDGYAEAAKWLTRSPYPQLLLIDPPFERADDYARVADLVEGRPDPARQPALIWTPLKDLETFDAFLGQLEEARPASLVVAQVRLRPLIDPMRMNGCAMVLVDAPDLDAEAHAAGGWIAARLGEAGASFRLARLA